MIFITPNNEHVFAFSLRNKLFMFISLVIMAVIFWFSSKDATGSKGQSDFFIYLFLDRLFEGEIPQWLSVLVRKAAHFFAYAGLGFSFLYGIEGGKRKILCSSLIAFGISVVYAVSDEIHQYFVPGRGCMALDVFIDACGAAFGILIGCLLLFIITGIRKKKSCR